MKKVISLAVSCALAVSMCIGAFAEGTTLGRSVTEQGEAAYMTMDGQATIGDMQINVTRNPAEELDADMIAQIESAAGRGAVCQEVLQVVSSIEKGTVSTAEETTDAAAATEGTKTASDAEAEREVVYALHSLVLETDLQEPDNVTMTVWFYNAVDDVWVTSESLYEYDHKEGTLQVVLQPGYTKAAIVTVQHKGITGYLRTVQNKLLKLM